MAACWPAFRLDFAAPAAAVPSASAVTRTFSFLSRSADLGGPAASVGGAWVMRRAQVWMLPWLLKPSLALSIARSVQVPVACLPAKAESLPSGRSAPPGRSHLGSFLSFQVAIGAVSLKAQTSAVS
jgi:hypothetical protein